MARTNVHFGIDAALVHLEAAKAAAKRAPDDVRRDLDSAILKAAKAIQYASQWSNNE